jgi:hypothetical protein
VPIMRFTSRQTERGPPVTFQSFMPDKTSPGVMFNCALCGGQTPQGQKHKCQLTDGQRKRLEQEQRLEGQRRRARMAARDCPDCGAKVSPAKVHACPGPPIDRDKSLAAAREAEEMAQASRMIRVLHRLGYKVEKI